jgi:hypothetical protein
LWAPFYIRITFPGIPCVVDKWSKINPGLLKNLCSSPPKILLTT